MISPAMTGAMEPPDLLVEPAYRIQLPITMRTPETLVDSLRPRCKTAMVTGEMTADPMKKAVLSQLMVDSDTS
jgi:hypothetical protein